MTIRHAATAALAALSAGALTACKDDDPTFVAQAPLAYVRYVNASPDSPALTARLIDQVENWVTADGVAFRGNSGRYYGAVAGTRRLSVSRLLRTGTIDTSAVVVLDTSFALQANTYYTIVQSGLVTGARGTAANTARVQVYVDTLPAASSIGTSSVVVRAYHLVAGTGAVDVALNKQAILPRDTTLTPPRPTAVTIDSAVVTTIAGLAFGARSAYVTVPAVRTVDVQNLYQFQIRSAGVTANLFAARPDVPGLAASAATTTTPPLPRTAGVRQSQSVLSLFIFPAAVAGSPAATTATAAPGVSLVPDQQPPS